MLTEIKLICGDQAKLAAAVFATSGEQQGNVVIAPAFGVPRQFYYRCSQYLAAAGYQVLVFDYRGGGDSRGCADVITMAQWGELDIEAALSHAARQSPQLPLYYIGHSCGGQLLGLAASSKRVDKAIFAGATLPHWRRYPAPGKYFLGFAWSALIPMIGKLSPVFPTKLLGLGSFNLPRGVVTEWGRWASSGDYLFSPEFDLDTKRYAQLQIPILSLIAEDDPYAPRSAAQALVQKYPSAAVEIRMLKAAAGVAGKIGHFGYFRSAMKDSLWPEILAWLSLK